MYPIKKTIITKKGDTIIKFLNEDDIDNILLKKLKKILETTAT